MKYLKKFERAVANKYKVDDYVYIKPINEYEPYCKITNSMRGYDPTIHTPIQYTAEVFNNENGKFEEDYIDDSMIIRKMKKSEIELFHQLKTLHKFNI